MTIRVRLPYGWDTIIHLQSVDEATKTIRSFRGERLATHGPVGLEAGSILVLHAGGNRYWPGVTEVAQVTRAGTIVTLYDAHGELRGAGPGRLESLGRRTRALLDELRSVRTSAQELDAIRALGAVDADRLALVIALAQGEGFQSRGDGAVAGADFDPEIAA